MWWNIKKRFIETKYLDIYIITYDVGHYEGHTLLFIQIMLCRFCWLFFFFLLVFFSPFSTAAVDFLLSFFFHSFGFLLFFSLFTQESLHASCLVIFFLGEKEVQLQQWLQLFLKERKSHLFFSPCIYIPYKCAGVFEGCSNMSLFLFKLSQNQFSLL
jgi:hypothetical protein